MAFGGQVTRKGLQAEVGAALYANNISKNLKAESEAFLV